MAARTDKSAARDGLIAAQARFPGHVHTIQELFYRDENFRGICDDLAAAEAVLAATGELPERIREDRRREYAELAESLVAEIAEALGHANVIHIPRPPNL
jgi:hypothetical protein